MSMFRLGLAAFLALIGSGVSAEVLPRQAPVAGTVVAVRTGEEGDFPERPGWRAVDVSQQLKSGDVLRTNALGQLAILFSDQTQIRLGRNTTLKVKDLVPGGDSRFELTAGSIWARAARGGTAVTIDTPAAAAAIRGTDWTMSVGPDGETALVVLEGKVELANDYGSVVVSPGEAATAAIGRAPTKTVVVRTDDREQMLYYVPLRLGFQILSASPLSTTRQREERARIDALPPASRSAGDLVARAEYAFNFDGREATRAAIAAARAARPDRDGEARLALLEALILAAEGAYGEASTALKAVRPRLDPQRRTIADYALYYADSLGRPERVSTPPATVDTVYAAVASAYVAAFLEGIPAAIGKVRAAEARWPDDPFLPAVRSQFAMLLGDRDQMREAYERSLALDPLEPTGLQARAIHRSDYRSDYAGALADVTAAIAVQPGSPALWNLLALVHANRDAPREAEAAILTSIALDPQDPLGHANRALLLLDRNRLPEAKAEIDRALALDPSFDVARVALGRWHLQRGEMDVAIVELLKGSTANPTYSNALLLLAAAYYQNGEIEPARQALDNADRLDANDPVTSIVRSRFAIDAYEADVAIAAAREALARSKRRGGVFNRLGENNDATSALADTLRFAGLDAWARYYGDRAFQPFDFSGYADSASSGNADPFADGLAYGSTKPDPESGSAGFSQLVQSLLFEPLAIASTNRRSQILRSPFFDVELGIGGIDGDARGPIASATVQAFANEPVPFSLYADLNRSAVDPERSTIDDERLGGTLFLGAEIGPTDRLTLFAAGADNRIPIPGPDSAPTPLNRDELDGYRIGGTWSHTFGWRNVANVAVSASNFSEKGTFEIAPAFDAVADIHEAVEAVEANHMIGGEDWTLVYGGKAGQVRNTTSTYFCILDNCDIGRTDERTDNRFARIYADLRYEPTDDVTLEAGLGATVAGEGAGAEVTPRIGAAWSFYEGQWLRAFARRDVALPDFLSLEPIDTVGLRPLEAPADTGSVVDIAGLAWEAEWSDRLFTSIEYQHQWFEALTITNPGTVVNTYAVADGQLDRIAASINLRLGGGFAAFGTASWTRSDDGNGNAIPYVPETMARVGLTYVSPERFKATLAGTYIGERSGDDLGTPVDGAFTLDALLHYEPLDGRFALDLGVYNILDTDFDVAPDTRGWGRTIAGKLSVRF